MRLKPFELFHWLFIKPYTFYWIMTAIGVGASLLGGIKAKRDANKGAQDIEALGRQNIGMVSQEEKETLRRMDYTQEQVMGQSKAQISASGMKMEGSTQRYMQELEKNYGNERNWIATQAQSQKDRIRLDASTQSRSLRNQGSSALLQGVGQAASWWSGGFGSGKKKTGQAVADRVGGNRGFLNPVKTNIGL